MRYRCISVRMFEMWLTVGKIYVGELVLRPSQPALLKVEEADDGYPCFAPLSQFQAYDN